MANVGRAGLGKVLTAKGNLLPPSFASIGVDSGLTQYGIVIGQGNSAFTATAAATNGQLLIGATGANPAFGTVTSPDGSLTFTTGINTLGISVTGGATVGKTITGDTGGALSPSSGNWNLLGTGSFTTVGSGSTLTGQLTGLTNHAVLVGAGTATITKLSVGTTGQLLIGATAADPAFGSTANADFTFGGTNSGATRTFTVSNTSNTASSAAVNQITVGGSSAADAQTTYTVTGATSWSTGIDNSASDAFVIAASTALGTSNAVSIATNGNVTFSDGIIGHQTTSASNYVVLATDFYVEITNDSTVTLPAAPATGQMFIIKSVSTNGGSVVSVSGGGTIDGSTTFTIGTKPLGLIPSTIPGATIFIFNGTEYKSIAYNYSLYQDNSAGVTRYNNTNFFQIVYDGGWGFPQAISPQNFISEQAQTSDATPNTNIYIDSTMVGSSISAACSIRINVDICAYNTDADLAASWTLQGTVRFTGSNSYLIGTPQKVFQKEGTMSGADVNITVGGVGDRTITIALTGIAATNIDWNVRGWYTCSQANTTD